MISFNPFSSGTVFIRQNQTSVDVGFWSIKLPAPKELKDLQINLKELNETFMIIRIEKTV